jgi:RNA polymerase primary sigma factor
MRQLKILKSITNRDTASLDRYLAESSKLPMISVEEEIILTRRIREGDQQALDQLTRANLRFVVSVAKQYQHQGMGLLDMINEGNLGLMKAARRFDETRGFKFISYAVWWIRQSIMQAVSEQSRMVRLPLNKIGALNKIKKMQSQLEQELERSASNSEISESLEMPEKEISTMLGLAGWHMSTDEIFPGNDNLTFSDRLFDPDELKPDGELLKDSLQIEIGRALATLSEREKDVLISFYGIGGTIPLTLEEIGNAYDLSRERVRQIKEKAVRKLRQASRSFHLRTYLGA